MPRLKNFFYLHHDNAENSKTRSPSCQVLYQHTEQQTVQKSIHKIQAAQTGKRERMCENSLKTCIWGKQIRAGEDSYNFVTIEDLPLSTYHSYKGSPSTVLLLYSLYSAFISTRLYILLFMRKTSDLCLNSASESRQRNISSLLHVKPVSVCWFSLG